MASKKKPNLPKHIRAHGTSFRFVKRTGGKLHQSPAVPTVEQAVAYRDAYLAAVDRGATAPVALSLADGLELILADCEASGAREATTAFYSRHARTLFRILGGADLMLHDIDGDDVRTYIASRRDEGAGPSTIVGKELFVLRRMRKLALDEGFVLPVDPFQGVRLPKARAKRFEFLTREQIIDVLAKLRAAGRKAPWLADVVELLFATGLRRAELVRLRVQDVDFDRGFLRVDGKTGPRHQRFTAGLVPTLRRMVDAAVGGRLVPSEDTVEKAFARWKGKLELPAFSPHVMRHSFATYMASKVPLLKLMTLLDHKDPKQTARYYHGRGDDVDDALEDLLPGAPVPQQSEGDDQTPQP